MRPTTLIFDLGGVVLSNDWHDHDTKKITQYTEYFSVPIDRLEVGWNAAWPKYKIGKTTEEQFWETFLRATQTNRIDVEKAKSIWRQHVYEIPNMLSCLKELRQQFRLAALSNIGREWLSYKRSLFQLDDLFSVIVDSASAGIAKPDQRMYQLLLDTLRVAPHECVYIDDLPRNIKPAKLLGMRSILFTDRVSLMHQLREMNLIQ